MGISNTVSTNSCWRPAEADWTPVARTCNEDGWIRSHVHCHLICLEQTEGQGQAKGIELGSPLGWIHFITRDLDWREVVQQPTSAAWFVLTLPYILVSIRGRIEWELHVYVRVRVRVRVRVHVHVCICFSVFVHCVVDFGIKYLVKLTACTIME